MRRSGFQHLGDCGYSWDVLYSTGKIRKDIHLFFLAGSDTAEKCSWQKILPDSDRMHFADTQTDEKLCGREKNLNE